MDQQPPPQPAYPPPAPPPPAGAPPVWWCHVGHCVLVALLGMVLGLGSGVNLFFPGFAAEQELYAMLEIDPAEMIPTNVLNCLLSVILVVAYGIAPFLPRTPRMWAVHLCLQIFSMTTCCCIPTAVPLLFFWLKAETRAWFGVR